MPNLNLNYLAPKHKLQKKQNKKRLLFLSTVTLYVSKHTEREKVGLKISSNPQWKQRKLPLHYVSANFKSGATFPRPAISPLFL